MLHWVPSLLLSWPNLLAIFKRVNIVVQVTLLAPAQKSRALAILQLVTLVMRIRRVGLNRLGSKPQIPPTTPMTRLKGPVRATNQLMVVMAIAIIAQAMHPTLTRTVSLNT